MKLKEGSYENLITYELNKSISDTNDSDYACKKEEIDEAESPSMIASHISNLVYNKLSDDSLSKEEKICIANTIIESLGESEEYKIADRNNILSAVISMEDEARLKATNNNLVRPLTGFRTSSLFTGGQSKIPLNAEIERDIESADRINLIISFLKLSGLNIIYEKLKKFCENPNHKLRIITTTYCGITEAKAVERLSKLPNTEIRISYNTKIERLHAKSYIFERNSGFSTAYIGSSNLSKSAQTDGLEWNIRVTNVENPHIINTALATFNIYWNSKNFEDFSIGGVDKLYEELKKVKISSYNSSNTLIKYNILPHQKQILDRLEAVRINGINRNLIVAATGTGKTVISAFDYKLFSDKNSRARILFVAHRQEILVQARSTYRSVLMDANFGDVWVGKYKPSNGIEHLFVSVPTFNSNYDDIFSILPDNFYDYIVIDEAHHLVAQSYRPILDKFKPKILLGLTATPERMDGQSLLPDFCNQISAEIRLPIALEEGLLTPFHYYCISDNTDLSDDDLFLGNKYDISKLSHKLRNKERVGLIIERLQYYLSDENKCKALCFCADTEHAKYMSESFNEYGLKSDYLISGKSKDREKLNKKLSKGYINYLFVVDIFNEGVDIPEIDTVLFLRPTESLTIFLQQLGRGLRLYPGKQELIVFDFVAQLNNKYDFSSRFRSLMIRPDKNIKHQIKDGFTTLPYGCTIHMEKKAQEYVLENIQSAVYTKKRLIKELRTYTTVPSLKEFIENNGQDIRLIYRGRSCWTLLKREAQKCDYISDGYTTRFERGLSNLTHVNSKNYLNFIKKKINNLDYVSYEDNCENTFALMLYYTLFIDKISVLGFKNIEEGFQKLKKYPLFITEINELIDYLLSIIEINTFSVGEGLPLALEQYGCYTREEIFTIFERQTADKKMQGSVTGVFNISELNTELFFVTLNKSDRDFSPSTMYDDYVVCEDKFHWKSQNTDTHEGRGKRFVEQKKNNKKFLLFVREYKNDGYGNTCPFYCFGLVDYISSYGDKPMSIDWSMHQPILPKFLN